MSILDKIPTVLLTAFWAVAAWLLFRQLLSKPTPENPHVPTTASFFMFLTVLTMLAVWLYLGIKSCAR